MSVNFAVSIALIFSAPNGCFAKNKFDDGNLLLLKLASDVLNDKIDNFKLSIYRYKKMTGIDFPSDVIVGLAVKNKEMFSEAASVLENIILLRKDDFAYYLRGVCYYKLGEYELASDDLDNAIKAKPLSPNYLLYKGLIYKKIRIFDKSFFFINKAISISQKNQDLYGYKAGVFFELGDFEKAIEVYSEGILINRESSWLFYNRGLAYRRLGDHERSISDFKKACEIDGNEDNLYLFTLGKSYYFNSNFKNAIDCFQRCKNKDGSDMRYLDWIGKTMIKMGDYNGAKIQYTEVLKIKPHDSLMLYQRSLCNESIGLFSEALIDIKNAISISPKNHQNLFLYGKILHKMGKSNEAINELTKCLDIEPHGLAFFERAKVYFSLGLIEQSIDDLSFAILNDTALYQAFEMRAKIYLMVGNIQFFLSDFESFLFLRSIEE